MPDLLNVFAKRWKFILGLTLVAGLVAFVASIISPKQYLSTATALPVNSVVADKGRLFNQNLENLYSDFGTADELDRLEGTGSLDTIYIAVAKALDLSSHYFNDGNPENLYKAVIKLKKFSRITRSGYGELKVKVWDEDRNMAAAMANGLMQQIQEIHQHLQNESNQAVYKKLEDDYSDKKTQFIQVSDSVSRSSGAEAEIRQAKKAAVLEQLQTDEKMMDQYRLAISTNPPVLLTVENARPSLWPDKPRVVQTVLLALFGAFVFGFLIALYIESRSSKP